jgi:hypothetical protein
MTGILSIKMKIRLDEDKGEICEQIIDTLKRIGGRGSGLPNPVLGSARVLMCQIAWVP